MARPPVRDLGLPVLLACVSLVELLGYRPPQWGWGVTLELAACAALVLRRTAPFWAPMIALVLGALPPWVDPALDEAAAPVAIAITAVYSLARWNTAARGMVAAGLGLVPLVANLLIVETDPLDVTDAVFLTALLVPPWVLGRLNRRLADQAAQLRAHQAVVRREAERDERDRIARDLHDVIAHSVSAMVVQTAAAQDLLRSDPDGTAELLDNVARTGREALAETGRLLHVIRDEHDELGLSPAPGLGRLQDLVEQYRASGLRVDLRLDEPLPDLAAGADVSAYRIVQEALTNALKYAPDGAVTLYVGAERGQLRIHTSNWCRTPAHGGAPGSGLGLVGMRERLAVLGGELTHRVTPEGRFDVTATLPLGAGG